MPPAARLDRSSACASSLTCSPCSKVGTHQACVWADCSGSNICSPAMCSSARRWEGGMKLRIAVACSLIRICETSLGLFRLRKADCTHLQGLRGWPPLCCRPCCATQAAPCGLPPPATTCPAAPKPRQLPCRPLPRLHLICWRSCCATVAVAAMPAAAAVRRLEAVHGLTSPPSSSRTSACSCRRCRC